jgi:Icc-related predicted phosphoesterase
MKEFCARNPGMHYLDGTSIEINGVTFAGTCGGWDDSYFQKINKYKPTREEIVNLFRRIMNDSRLIFADGKRSPKTEHFDYYAATNYTTFDPVKHFEGEMVKLNSIASADVMITHYGPAVPPDMRPAYATSPVTTFYYFNGDETIDRLKPKVWVYGHTHDYHEFTHHGTRFLCNPLDYPGEQGFARVKYFDV